MAHAIGVSRRTVDNYRSGGSLPADATLLADLFFGDDPRHAVKRHAFLATFAKATGTEPPLWAAAISNVPIREPAHFMGRDDALAALQVAFGRNVGRVFVTALHGLRGVGKTTLVAAYAERHRADHRAIWWIRAETEAGLRADLIALGLRLAWTDAKLDEERALAAVMDRLRDEGDGLLLIYDNALSARQIAPYLPIGGGARILATSNAPDWRELAEPIEITVWPTAVGADYLIARTDRKTERAAAEALSDALGGLPLAHEQAAAYCEKLEITLAEYGRRFADRKVAMLEDPRYAPVDYYNGRTVAATFALAIEAATSLHPAAEPLIGCLALLAPEPIPLFLLREGRRCLCAPLNALLDGDGLDEVISALRALALVGRESIVDERTPAVTTETLHLHRLVREVASARLAAEVREGLQCGLVQALREVYPANVSKAPDTWPRARRLDGLVLALVNTEAGKTEGVQPAAGWLLDRVAAHKHHAQGAYEQARLLYARGLAIMQTELGPGHPSTATILSNLAGLYRDQGRLEEAAQLGARARGILETVFGDEHLDVATILRNLAVLYRDLGRLEEATQLGTRALAIQEKVLGPDHPGTAASLTDLADLYRGQGRQDEAAPLYARALAILEQVSGPDHLDTASCLNNLAGLYRDQDRLDEAAPLYARALAIREKVLDPDHPDIATSLNNLAWLYQDQGRIEEAALLCARALVIREKVLDSDHPDTANSLINKASLCRAQGQLEEATLLCARALAIQETALDANHPDIVNSLYDLAGLYRDQERLDEAAPLYARALAIQETALNANHPGIVNSLYDLAELYRDQGRLDEAAPLYARARAIREKVFNRDHPNIATILNNLAGLYRVQGRLEEATLLCARALVIVEAMLVH